MTQGSERHRDSGEFFGLERLLWDDRYSGALSASYQQQLAEAERELAVEMRAGDGRAEALDAERNRALLDAIKVARSVLSAACDALREREAPVFGPRA